MKRISLLLGVLAFNLLAASLGHAEILTWRASGAVTFISNPAALPFPVLEGDDFAVQFSFDTAANSFSVPPDAPETGRDYENTLLSMTVTIGTHVIPFTTFDSKFIRVLDDFLFFGSPLDELLYQASGSSTGHAQTFYGLLELRNSTGAPSNAVTSLLLPDSLPSLESFNSSSIELDTVNADFSQSRVYGSVTSLTSVPLPAAAWLLLSGAGALGAMARRRRSAPAPLRA